MALDFLRAHLRDRFNVRPLLAVFSVGLFYTYADVFTYATYSAPAPIVWVLALLAVTAMLALIEHHAPLPFMASPLAAWVLFYFIVTTAWAIFMRNLPELSAELDDRYRSIGSVVTFAIIFSDSRARRVAVMAVASCVVLAASLNLAESASLVTFPDVPHLPRTPGRAAGLYCNPNTSGLAIAMGLAIATEQLARSWRVPFVLLGAFGVAATFSRGAMICVALVLFWLVWRRALGSWPTVFLVSCAIVLFRQGFEYLQSSDRLTENTASRLEFAADDSGRAYLALKAWDLFQRHPLLGNGLGSTAIWSSSSVTHNTFLTLGADHGILGLLAFPALGVALVARNRAATPFALALMAGGLFSSEILTDRFVLLLIALAGVATFEPSQQDGVGTIAMRPVRD